MAKEYFERHGEFKEFDSENNRIISIGNHSEGRFYISVDTVPSDVHFDGALLHEKMSVKRTDYLASTNNVIILNGENENGINTQTTVNQNAPQTRVTEETEFDSVKQSVLSKLQQLNLL